MTGLGSGLKVNSIGQSGRPWSSASNSSLLHYPRPNNVTHTHTHATHTCHTHMPHTHTSHTHMPHTHTTHTPHTHTTHTCHTHTTHTYHTHMPHTHATHTCHTHTCHTHMSHTHVTHPCHTHMPHTYHPHTIHTPHTYKSLNYACLMYTGLAVSCASITVACASFSIKANSILHEIKERGCNRGLHYYSLQILIGTIPHIFVIILGAPKLLRWVSIFDALNFTCHSTISSRKRTQTSLQSAMNGDKWQCPQRILEYQTSILKICR